MASPQMDTTSFCDSKGFDLTHLPPLELVAIFILITSILSLMLYVHLDYLAFISLGPGGTPSTLVGYLTINLLKTIALRNLYQPLPVRSHKGAMRGHLSRLPARKGRRPVTRGIAPQRQVTDKANSAILEKLATALQYAGSKQSKVVLGTSCIEKHGIALFKNAPSRCNEICHLHSSDGSMHMRLSAADSKTVIDTKWGERHPLSRGGWFERFVPESFMLIYAPRDEVEIETIMKIVHAAIWYVEGKAYATSISQKAINGEGGPLNGSTELETSKAGRVE